MCKSTSTQSLSIPKLSLSNDMETVCFQDECTSNKKTRRKLWELTRKLHCPVIGTCLEAHELEKIANKTNASTHQELSEYDIHVSFVSAAGDQNSLSLATQKVLDKKYAAYVRRTSKFKTADQLEAFWDEATARGEVPGALWTLVTHPKCSDELRMCMYEEVHMLSHQIGAGQRADLKRLSEAETELAQLRREIDQLQKKSQQQIAQRDKRIQILEKDLERSEEAHRQTQQSKQAVEQERDALKDKLNQAGLMEKEKQLSDISKQLQQTEIAYHRTQSAYTKAEETIGKLKSDYREKQAECQTLEKLITREITSNCASCTQDECNSCPDLNGQHILCVGGYKRLISHYRSLVNTCNGSFTHHDGGMEDNRQCLEAMLSSADAVICAADFVSHDAYYRLKRFCKRNQKPHALLRSSGISTFARVLDRMAVN